MSSNPEVKAAAMAQIRQFGDPVLKEKSRPAQISEELLELVERMTKIMYAAEGVGLAAPQIGVLQRVIVCLLDEQLHVLVNPEIIWRSEETVTDTEGCLSLAGLSCEVERAERVKVSSGDLGGEQREFDLEGMHARILQHEIDHLDGTMIVNRTSREQRKMLMKHLRQMKFPGED